MAQKKLDSLFESSSEGILDVPENCGAAVSDAVKFFNMGNFADCRKVCRRITTDPDYSKDDKAFANELLVRTGTDPVILYIALASVLLLIFLALWSWTKSH